MTRLRPVLLGALALLLLGVLGFEHLDRPGDGAPGERGVVWADLTLDPPGGMHGGDPLWIPASAYPRPASGGGASAEALAGAEERLRAFGAGRPLVVEVSDGGPPARARMPLRLREGRASVGVIRVDRGVEAPGSLLLRGEAGVVDTIPGRELPDGSGLEFPLLFEPVRAGWTPWEIEGVPGVASADPITWWGWVEPARPLRVLALSGPPTPESRFALRALEEAGEEVEAWIHLGRGLWTGRGRDQGLPTGEAARELYRGFDLILLFPGLDLPEAQRGAIDRAVRESGLGLLLAGRGGGDETESSGAGITERPAAELTWTEAPLELPTLPEVELDVRIRGEGTEVVRVGVEGRGRVAEMSLIESWRWRMEAGAEAEHRAFWHGLAGWLTGGFGPDPVVEVLGADLVPGDPVRARWLSSRAPGERAGVQFEAPGAPPRVSSIEPDPLAPDRAAFEWEAELAWAGVAAGPHRIAPVGSGEEAVAGEPDPRAAGGWTHLREPGEGLEAALDPEGLLARRALGSPTGRLLAPELFAAGLERRRSTGLPGWMWPLLFLLLAGLAGGEWALRRSRGLA